MPQLGRYGRLSDRLLKLPPAPPLDWITDQIPPREIRCNASRLQSERNLLSRLPLPSLPPTFSTHRRRVHGSCLACSLALISHLPRSIVICPHRSLTRISPQCFPHSHGFPLFHQSTLLSQQAFRNGLYPSLSGNPWAISSNPASLTFSRWTHRLDPVTSKFGILSLTMRSVSITRSPRQSYTEVTGHQCSHLSPSNTTARWLRRQSHRPHPVAQPPHILRRVIPRVPPFDILLGAERYPETRGSLCGQSCGICRLRSGDLYPRGAHPQ